MIKPNKQITFKAGEYIPQFHSGMSKKYGLKYFTNSLTVKDLLLNKFSQKQYAAPINPFMVTL